MIIAITQWMAAAFLIKSNFNNPFLIELCLLSFSTILIAAGGYIVNDYFDVKIDLINKPKEVFVGRILKRRYVALLHQFLSAAGLIVGALVNWQIFVVNLFSVIVLWFYASMLKKKLFIGNLLVAFLTGLSVYEIVFISFQNTNLVLFYAGFAFFSTLIREIVKDIEDIEGDSKNEANTLPIKFGIRTSKYFIYIAFSFLIAMIIAFLLTNQNQKWLMVFGILVFFSFFIMQKIYLADQKKHFAKISYYCKLFMVCGILSMVLNNNN